MKKFYIPVTWESWDKVQVEAETIEEAIQYVKDNIYDLDFGQDGGEYIDDSCHIDDGQNGEASIEDTILHLKECCNLPGGIEGINIGEVITEYDDKGQCIYHKNPGIDVEQWWEYNDKGNWVYQKQKRIYGCNQYYYEVWREFKDDGKIFYYKRSLNESPTEEEWWEYNDKGRLIYHKNYNDESKYEYLDDGTVISTTIRKPFKKYNPGEK